MPNKIDSNGLQTKTQNELINEISTKLKNVYGQDISLAPDTPDGQAMMIFIQAIMDNLDLVEQVYNQFDPDTAVGKQQDRLYSINGIQRQSGTRTIQEVEITTDRALNLYGTDQDSEEVYKVSDDQGNEWELISTKNIASSGTYTFEFQSATVGKVLTTPNTITNPVTVVVGVTNINNPSSYKTLGLDEETDAEYKIRRKRSVSLSGQGYQPNLVAALENINETTFVSVLENETSTVDADGIPGHGIWAIVGGTASDEDIANAIYKKRSTGANMKGTQTYNIDQPDGTKFTVKWDEVETEALHIAFDAESLDGSTPPKETEIKNNLGDMLSLGVYEQVDVNEVATQVQNIDDNTLVKNCKVSLSDITGGNPGSNKVRPSAKNKKFTLSTNDIDITVV